jgi:DNA-binding XRE family transcriptional regulator
MKNTVEFLLAAKGLSKAELAKNIGVSRQTVNNVVKGKTPSLEVAIAIANYFGKDVKDVFLVTLVKQSAQRKKETA